MNRAKAWLTPAQALAFDRYAIDNRQANEKGLKRWRSERRLIKESGLRDLTVIVKR